MDALLSGPALDFFASASDRAVLAFVVVAELYELSRAHAEFRAVVGRKDAQLSALIDSLDRKTETVAVLSEEIADLRERLDDRLDELTDYLTSS